MRQISILGSTGSIGRSSLDLIAHHQDKFKIKVLTAGSNYQLLAEQARKFLPDYVVIADETYYSELKQILGDTDIEVQAGRNAILHAASESVDLSIAAIVGFAGLEPVLNAVKSAKAIALANKEPLVAAGELVMNMAAQSGCKILPTDSEHNAIFQVFEAENRQSIDRLILTASGGPFRTWAADDIAKAKPEQALKHPNWSMGAKITIDSASLMNKALEVIEAFYLFDMPADKIDVVVHPQSIIHSFVEYNDGSVLAQLGAPDMRTPIAYCLGWPERIATSGERLDVMQMASLSFEQVRADVFPVIDWAYEALKAGQGACISFNAANEVAVEAYLQQKISFQKIYDTIKYVCDQYSMGCDNGLEAIIDRDKHARKAAIDFINA